MLLATKEGEFSWDLLLLYAPDCYYFHIAVSVCAVAFNIQQSSLTPRPSLQFGTKKSQFSSLFMASNPRFDKCSPCAIFHSPSPPYCFPLYLVRSHYHKSNSNLSSSVVKKYHMVVVIFQHLNQLSLCWPSELQTLIA